MNGGAEVRLLLANSVAVEHRRSPCRGLNRASRSIVQLVMATTSGFASRPLSFDVFSAPLATIGTFLVASGVREPSPLRSRVKNRPLTLSSR